MNILLQIGIGGMLGAFIHTLVKVNSINKRLQTVNYKEVFYEYWKTDWPSFILSILVIASAVYISNEWLNVKETDKTPAGIYEMLQYKIAQFVKTTAIVLGYCTDSIVTAFLGSTEQKLIKKAKEEGVSMDDIIKTKS